MIRALFFSVVVWAHPVLAQDAPKPQPKSDPHQLGSPITGAKLLERVLEARRKGFEFLVRSQNGDGSWGSHDPKIANLKDFGFQLNNRGSQDGVRLACTAICAKALLMKSERTPAESSALERAIDVLLGEERMAYHRGEAFNTWGYGYKLDFLMAYHDAGVKSEHREQLKKAVERCVQGLRRFQLVDGGWNYYAGPLLGGESMSFNTAVFAMALARAKKAGFEVHGGMYRDAGKLLKRMRTRKGGFVYDARFLHDPRAINELSAGGRTAVCALALFELGLAERDELDSAMRVFNEGENYLEDGRKLIQPHTAVHQISGYFFFFGYNYITRIAQQLGASVPQARWDRFVWTMIRTQEEDGCWWDTAAANYGDKWGTGFALLVLQRYLDREPGKGGQ
jgi:hypothetical protein